LTIHDVTIPLSAGVACWPGDRPYDLRLAWDQEDGASVNVGAVTSSLHNGTHVDAPFHFKAGGNTVDQLDLSAFIGPALVLDVSGKDPIRLEDLERPGQSLEPRLLLRTGAWRDHTAFPTIIPTLAPDVPAALAARGVVLIGVDVPSVDVLDSKELPIHHALAKSGIQIVESLALDAVPEGRCHLIALPLRLVGADASPVRAVLVRAD